jgi:hypothetical protein
MLLRLGGLRELPKPSSFPEAANVKGSKQIIELWSRAEDYSRDATMHG